MRTLTYTFALIFLTLFSLSGQNNFELRISHKEYKPESQLLTVSLDVKSTDKNLVLAGQNFRLFYSSEVFKLDESKSGSLLPQAKYSPMLISETLSSIDAREVGQLSFDHNLGFVNLAIDLRNVKEGGIKLDQSLEWTSIAQLTFKVTSMDNIGRIVWAREGLTDQYATAFVSMAKWVAPLETNTLDISAYHDFEWSVSHRELSSEEVSYTILPNPSADYLNLTINKSSPFDRYVELLDINGQLVRKYTLEKGTTSLRVEVANLKSANYSVFVLDTDRRLLHSDVLTVIH